MIPLDPSIGALLLAQARIPPHNSGPHEPGDQYAIDAAEIDVDGICVTNWGVRHVLKVVEVSITELEPGDVEP